MIKKPILTLLSALLVSACATSPTGRTQFSFMPDAQINQMGLQAFESLKKQKPITQNSRYQQFASCVAQAMIPLVGGQWEVVVFEDNSQNAFALPGNKIGVHTGLIDLVDNQDQLATVIGHEIGHVLAKHSNERMSQEFAVTQGMAAVQAIAAPQSALGQTAIGLLGAGAELGIILPYSRLHESEADVIGLDLMAKAGFDPQQSILLWQKMSQASGGQGPAEFLSTHPAHGTRIEELQKRMPQALQYRQQAIAMGKQPRCAK